MWYILNINHYKPVNMTPQTALMLLNNQLRLSHFNFNNPDKEIWAGTKSYTLKELIIIAYNIKP